MPTSIKQHEGLAHSQSSPSTDLDHRPQQALISTEGLETKAKSSIGWVFTQVRKAPLAAQILTGEFALAYWTHPHMSVIRGGLALLGASMAWDAWKRHSAKKKEEGK